jgi:hypothetical protein
MFTSCVTLIRIIISLSINFLFSEMGIMIIVPKVDYEDEMIHVIEKGA